MASVNKVIIMGNLGADPELKTFQNGGSVTNISIATTSAWKDKTTGERREKTEWHRVVLYNRLAEITAQYLRKGRAVYIEGRLETRKWQDQNGVDKYTTEIIAEQMQMIGSKSDNPPASNQNQPSVNATTNVNQELDDDIPF